MPHADKRVANCRVVGCKRVAETTWEPDIRPCVYIPVREEKEPEGEKHYDAEEPD